MPPKLPQPSPRREIWRPVVPSRRYSMPLLGRGADPLWPRPRYSMAAPERNSQRSGRDPMRKLPVAAACLAASTSLAGQPTPQGPGAAGQDPRTGISIVLDNARVRVFKASTALAVVDHPAAVVVVLEDGGARRAGDAYWSGDPAVPQKPSGGDVGSLIIVEPKESAPPHTSAPRPPDTGTRPGETVFKGMSFKPLFDNERVTVIRGRMEVGAQEGF